MLQFWFLVVLFAKCAGGDVDEKLTPDERSIPSLLDLKVMYYINLDTVPLRRWHMQQQLRATRLPAKRFPAVAAERVEAGEFNQEFINVQGFDKTTLRLTPRVANSTAACFLSHVQALRQASKELKPNEFALIMEDDVVIPKDWAAQIQAAMQAAPKGWRLLKVSGWGSGRDEDVVKEPSLWSRVNRTLWHYFGTDNRKETPELKFYALREPFTEPESPMKFFYAGTGAYLVRGSGIPKILTHLLSRPIKDVDSMLLSNEVSHFYEEWPHIFDLSKDAFGDTSMHYDDQLAQANSMHLVNPANARTGKASDAWMDESLIRSTDKHKHPAKHIVASDQKPTIPRRASRRNLGWRIPGNLKPGESSDGQGQEQASLRNVTPENFIRKATRVLQSFLRKTTPDRPNQDHSAPNGEHRFDHPPWLQQCQAIYLDVGSNIGVQVRKLFETERYPGAAVLPLFEEEFGTPSSRSRPGSTTRLCALGIEPNPSHWKHLRELEEKYTKRGWYVHFYPYAAWKKEGSMRFNQVIDPKNEDWGAHLASTQEFLHNQSKRHFVEVRTVDLAEFVKTLPPASVKLMKMDIEGAEYQTIARLLQEHSLCKGTIEKAFIEAHAWGDITNWQAARNYSGIEYMVRRSDCGSKGHTQLVALDDESYRLDTANETERITTELYDDILHPRGLLYFAALLIFAACVGCIFLSLGGKERFWYSKYGQALEEARDQQKGKV